MIEVPKTVVLDFASFPALGNALEKKINEANETALVPVTSATKYIIDLIKEHVKE